MKMRLLAMFIATATVACAPAVSMRFRGTLPLTSNLGAISRTNWPALETRRWTALYAPNWKPDNIEENTGPPAPFVGIAISGGGSRSAYFSAVVLEKLQQVGVLPLTVAISSVSGGSLTAAHYAAFGNPDDPHYWQLLKSQMGQDLLHPWLSKYASLYELARTSLTTTTRTDLMSDVFDEKVFLGRKFESLGTPQIGVRPYIYINSTFAEQVYPQFFYDAPRGAGGLLDRGSPETKGLNFVFTSRQFESMAADLAHYRIADAVMASGAFPGVFNSVTLAGYPFAPTLPGQNVQSTEGAVADKFLHVMDGGPSDNLGIDALIGAARRYHFFNHDRGAIPCLLVIVDAAVPTPPDAMYKTAEGRKGFVDYIVDRNALTAADAMMRHRRMESLAYLGIDFENKNRDGYVDHFVETKLPLADWAVRRIGDTTMNVWRDEQGSDDVTSMTCNVWHIGLGNINDVRDPPALSADIGSAEKSAAKRQEMHTQRSKLAQLVGHIETNYLLTGIEGCKPSDIATLLDVASQVLVQADKTSLRKVCDFIAGVTPNKAGACLSDNADGSRIDKAVPECAEKLLRGHH